MNISYKINAPLAIDTVCEVYDSAGLPRPTHDRERIGRMFANSNLIISAWDGETLVGISRALTDFSFCCYLSDLAVRKEYQKQGIGKRLVALTKEHSGPEAMLLLLSVPGAMEYYPAIGMDAIGNAFMIKRER